jgi:hypothetical protein
MHGIKHALLNIDLEDLNHGISASCRVILTSIWRRPCTSARIRNPRYSMACPFIYSDFSILGVPQLIGETHFRSSFAAWQ